MIKSRLLGSKTSFYDRNQVFHQNSPKSSFYNQNWACHQNWPKPLFYGQNKVCHVIIGQNRVTKIKCIIFQSK